MTKLHEIIAVEPDLKSKASASVGQTKSAFGNAQPFIGEVRTYQPIDEEGERFPDEITNMTATVKGILASVEDEYGNWLDVTLQKEVSNTETSADVIVNGEVVFEGLPSPALLNLESRLEELRGVYSAIPTLDLTEIWHYDAGQEVYVSDPRQTFRTKKVLRNHVKAEATKEHPAQVEIYTEDVRSGTWTKVVRSGAITVKEKRQMLQRLDDLLVAVKQARQRANSIDIHQDKYSTKLFGYINTGKF